MTDRKRVFCKDCKWYVKHRDICVPVPFYNPITGKILDDNSWREPWAVNANCDCADYEPKEGGDD